MSYSIGDMFYTEFITSNVSGIPTNTDATPGGTFFRNTIDDLTVPVFVSNVDTGRYRASGLIPTTYTLPASVGICISGYVASQLLKGIFDFGPLLRPVSVSGGAPANFLPPATTVSVTGLTVNSWSTAEQNQLRYKLGIDGTATPPTSGLGHMELSASGLESISIETGINARQAFTINTAVLAGISSGSGPWIWYQGINNTTQNRLSSNATSGIRTTVNYVLP